MNERKQWDVMPLLQLLFEECKFETLYLHTGSLFTQTLQVEGLVMPGNNRFQWVTTIWLEVNKYDFLVNGIYSQTKTLQTADKYRKMLGAACHLQRLSLGLQLRPLVPKDTAFLRNKDWVHEILSGQRWPHLVQFSLQYFGATFEDLSNFFSDHSASLDVVRLEQIWMDTDAHRYNLAKHMRESLTLSDARVEIKIMTGDAPCSELDVIFRDWSARPGRHIDRHCANPAACPNCIKKLNHIAIESYILKHDT